MPATTDSVGMAEAPAPNPPVGKEAQPVNVDIIDIRQAAVEINLKEEIHSMFWPEKGPRRLPTLLLYDEKGLQLFEQITYLEEYYLTNSEIEVLKRHAADIAQVIPCGSMVIELGSGNLRKVSLLLQALEDAAKKVDYYALDLSEQELHRTLAQLPVYEHVQCHGLLGTYDDGREWLKKPEIRSRPKCILSLGSSVGNFERHETGAFLKGFANVLQPSDMLLIGLDSCQDPSKIYHAYNDREGVTHRFIFNGLRHANEILGEEAFAESDWEVIGEYVFDGAGGRHQAFLAPVRDTTVQGQLVKAHERVQIEQSLKYPKAAATSLWAAAGMTQVAEWMTSTGMYGLHLLSKPNMPFNLNPSAYAIKVLPTLQDWDGLWAVWDIVTRGMLPNEELHDKPIKLRNACVFYLGHIPTFLDIQLTKTTKQPPTRQGYCRIFERGIDPDVDNPEHCHAHSEIPDEWPPVEEIVQYQDRVRNRLRSIYSVGQENIPRNIGRAIWVGFEHEAMHLETLLYMMLQSDKTQPPPHNQRPDFEQLAKEARSARVPNEWITIPEQSFSVGLDDPEDGTNPSLHFGWDNEKPARQVEVHSFEAKGRPITNEEYARYMYDKNVETLPASWATLDDAKHNNDLSNGRSNGSIDGPSQGLLNGGQSDMDGSRLPPSFLENKAVRTLYGLVPLKYALDWPIFASYDELAGCASWMGGRIPTYEEAQSIYTHVGYLKKKEAERTLGKTVPAVNSHLVNDGVEETPPSRATKTADEGPSKQDELFIDLTDANVGFANWHQVPVTARGGRLGGQAETGGVWEWTSSPLEKHEGFEPMPLYPAYTADFFDGKHNIVLGGSWATHPRIAGRRSFVNWYQRNYPYAWVGARLVRDA